MYTIQDWTATIPLNTTPQGSYITLTLYTDPLPEIDVIRSVVHERMEHLANSIHFKTPSTSIIGDIFQHLADTFHADIIGQVHIQLEGNGSHCFNVNAHHGLPALVEPYQHTDSDRPPEDIYGWEEMPVDLLESTDIRALFDD